MHVSCLVTMHDKVPPAKISVDLFFPAAWDGWHGYQEQAAGEVLEVTSQSALVYTRSTTTTTTDL